MNGIIPQVGELAYASQDIANLLNGAKARLFSNNYTVLATTVLSDLVEASFSGYSAQLLSGWSTPSIGGDGSAGTYPAPVTFTPTSSGGSGNLYGYYITDSTGTILLAVWNFTSPPSAITVPIGVGLQIQPNYSVLSRY